MVGCLEGSPWRNPVLVKLADAKGYLDALDTASTKESLCSLESRFAIVVFLVYRLLGNSGCLALLLLADSNLEGTSYKPYEISAMDGGSLYWCSAQCRIHSIF